MWRHPSSQTLEAWLAGAADEKLDDHLLGCERCAATLERLGTDDGHPPVRDALLVVLEPRSDLGGRLYTGVTSRLKEHRFLHAAVDLVGSGIDALRLLFDNSPNEEDGVSS